MVNALFAELAALPQVEAIALGGSRAGETYDEKSDYDVYLYCTGPVERQQKLPILQKYCSYMELSNHFWELEDNCTLKNGIDMDILYRNMEEFGREVAAVVEDHQAHNGYTTCMWHNLRTCKILYDPQGKLQALKDRFSVPYPTQLQENIIQNNMKLLYDYMPAYYYQIQKALDRGDWVSVNHRCAAFMESYFDVIFAMNGQTHPGEKRLVSLCKAQCEILPRNFEEHIQALYQNLFQDGAQVMALLDSMISELKCALQEKGRGTTC